jgi:hypothetical protein
MTLKIEAGKYYRTQDGRKVGPLRHLLQGSAGRIFKFDVDDYAPNTDTDVAIQLWDCAGNGDEGLNLISEWGVETAAYDPLRRVLDAAYAQAANGKGKERHASDKPFMKQPIMEIARMVGPGYQLGQAMKKAQEAGGMIQRGQPNQARAELLGAINYLAACVLLIEGDAK